MDCPTQAKSWLERTTQERSLLKRGVYRGDSQLPRYGRPKANDL